MNLTLISNCKLNPFKFHKKHVLITQRICKFGVKEPLTMTELVSVKIKLAQNHVYSDITVTNIILAYESNMTVRFLKVVFLGFPGG